MSNEAIIKSKKDIIAIGRLLWDKELVTGLNGNISTRVEDDKILLTATQTCLGLLQENEILILNLSGEVLEPGQVSTEKLLHTSIYQNFPYVKAVIHTHLTYANAFFLENDHFSPRIFEAKFYLGEINAIPQTTPSVTDSQPVIETLKKNNIAVLKNHGVVAIGENLFDCFLLIQGLEDAVKVETISRFFTQGSRVTSYERRTIID